MSTSGPSVQDEAENAAAAGNAMQLEECFSRGARVDTFVYSKALQNGDVDTYRVILDNGGHIDYNLGTSGNALTSALRHHHDPLLEFLFANSVDVNNGHWGHMLPPVGVAVRMNRNIKWTERLLQAGARLNETGALHIAAIMGDLPKIKLLLSFGADVNEVPACTIMGFVRYNKKGSPVHWAIYGSSADAVQLLLQYHPDLDVLDEDGVSVYDRLQEAHLPLS
ncbi:hypothetical protein SI65_01970 [Aspergillus cristatus]|uniref:Uncharacterized protein n=1 Tax=Aspergillus cristatus TaxID=573508 RepID=A0A1E3BTM1_ASPCR|nr:hypothetical protein SI65_01912 [Aspergillus cristatus]ODM24380.1 hypothetical protein SI65_01970 [Aspergillus cristatus]